MSYMRLALSKHGAAGLPAKEVGQFRLRIKNIKHTPSDSISQVVHDARAAFASGKTQETAFRKEMLRAVYGLVDENEDMLIDALKYDLQKPSWEARGTELDALKGEAVYHLENIVKWVRGRRAEKTLFTLFDHLSVKPVPKGTALILGAWNYPIGLLLTPLIGAISAGNCAVIKPSEHTVASCTALAELIPQYLDRDCYKVVLGGAEVTDMLLAQPFDHIFFTGAADVGKKIMHAAADHLCPVTLELGGKSPCIVDDDASITNAARRIAWGRYVNAGQTCLAPDYVLVHDKVADKLVDALKAAIVEFYGEDASKSQSYGRMVSQEHVQRLATLIESTAGTVVYGGAYDVAERYVQPTIIKDVAANDALMQEEIFGPILPILVVSSMDEAINFVKQRMTPLAVYVFAGKTATINDVSRRTASGMCVGNDTHVQAHVHGLPYGGVGQSGFGSYHGKYSFELFSHQKTYMVRPKGLEFLNSVRYPPYTDTKGWAYSMQFPKLEDNYIMRWLR